MKNEVQAQVRSFPILPQRGKPGMKSTSGLPPLYIQAGCG
jgi:hypothetical protein